MSDDNKRVCESGVDIVPPIKPAWEMTLPSGYVDEGARQLVAWGGHVVCLLQSSVYLLNPRDGVVEGGSDIMPEEKGHVPLEVKDLVVGAGGRAYAWARFGQTQISEWCAGEQWQTEELAFRQGYPKADWAVAQFDLKSGDIVAVMPPPRQGFQSSNEIGRQGRFLKSDDGHFFDWRIGQWLNAIPAGEVLSDPPWRSKEGFTIERMKTGWHRLSREGVPDRFVKLPCDAFCVHEGADYLIGGLSRRRIVAWRCDDLATNGLQAPIL